jgi:hypothetical protein
MSQQSLHILIGHALEEEVSWFADPNAADFLSKT